VPLNPLANWTKTTLKSRKLLSVKEENYSYRSTGLNRSGFVIENILDTVLFKGVTCVCTKVKNMTFKCGKYNTMYMVYHNFVY
jgi:hypothetical protein